MKADLDRFGFFFYFLAFMIQKGCVSKNLNFVQKNL